MSLTIAASSANCALSQVFFSLDRVNLRYDETLLVQGAGGLGLHAMAVAKARGARVIAIDGVDLRSNERKPLALMNLSTCASILQWRRVSSGA